MLEGLDYLHHPLRAEASKKYVQPSLDMLWEIQKTGDIFFPKRWLDATLGGHSTQGGRRHGARVPEDPAARIIRSGLRNITLQSADELYRAADIDEANNEYDAHDNHALDSFVVLRSCARHASDRAATEPGVTIRAAARDRRARRACAQRRPWRSGTARSPASARPAAPSTYDLGNLTLLPGFIDTHVHIGWHFDDKGRYHAGPEPPEQAALYGAENAYVTLMAGFTTVQSVGALSDKPLRDAIDRGVLPGPRILISLGQISNAKWTPDQIREDIRKKKADGADLIKIFASASIRDGGMPTLSQEQVDAACGEARAQGLRSMVHAHSPESMLRAARAQLHGRRARRARQRRSAARRWPTPASISIRTSAWSRRTISRTRRASSASATTPRKALPSMEKALGLQGRDVLDGAQDAGAEDGDGHRRGGRRARPERARADRARQGRPEADGRDRRHDLAGGGVDGARQGDRRDRARASMPTSSRSRAIRCRTSRRCSACGS